ncbi:MAG TPA: glycosyltransferase [Candidatus Pacearchaeota archaeon]|nr:glycosyltransferase [Candidatus Pacearchaeota archaeon]
MLSIIIPTLNEENFLPDLLNSIKNQNFSDYEIIISDNGSTDKTLDIAKKYNCRITKGGLPAKARNNGAKIAKGDLFLFLDSDTILPQNFLKKSLNEFKKRNLDLASFYLLPSNKNIFLKLGYIFFYNLPVFLLKKITPHAAIGILIKRELFKKLNGFDETIKIAEDHDLARRAKKQKAKTGFIRSVKLITSDRRFRQDGWVKTYLKYIFCEFHLIFLGPIRSNIVEYKFNHYKNLKNKN